MAAAITTRTARRTTGGRAKLHTSGAWGSRYPNPPDLSFDYRRLVEQTGGIAQATAPDHKICIIGAGITGLTAARELYRCGFNNVTVMEAGDRIAGRHYTITDVANQGLATRYAPSRWRRCACLTLI